MFLGHSGGKDSTVILHLTKFVVPKFKIVHNVKPMLGTSGDPVGALTEQWPQTLEFMYTDVCKNNSVTFMHSTAMEQWVSENNLLCQIDGARKSEATRAGKSANIIRDGVSVSRSEMKELETNGIFGLAICYPILDWTDVDVFDYLTENKIAISKEYYVNGELESYLNGTMKG
jgi:3'-phosphoadenosine 5'-phosphosulfate sulfotransferase (PAPS reductase)/FAD synthetase